MASLKLTTPPEPMPGEDKFDGKGIETYKRWFQNAEETHQKARALAHRDRDWYDNYDDGQWDEREKQILIRRGQPVVTMNRIKRKVNFLCGIEQKSRSDPKAYPRKPQNTDQAQVATDVLDYIEHTVRFDNIASASFKSLCIEGIAAVDVCYEADEGASGIVAKEIDFDQFFYDPRSRRPDYSDARYLGYHNWYDLDDALSMFKDSKDAEAALKGSLSSEVTDEGYDDKPRFRWGDAERQRVRVACMYWKDASAQWNYVYFAGGGIIEEGASKYLTDKGKTDCPIIAASAYVTRENERYGTVRDMISPQSEMNYRRSMALFLMKNRRVWSAAGVFNPDQNIKEEIARADAHIIANGQFGTEWGFIESQSEVAQNFELLQDAKGEIDVQGPNAGLQGRGVEQQSGRAIQAQQNAGLAEENTLFDTHNDWKLRVYRAFWARAKQFWTEEMFIRISDEDAPGGARFTPVNASPQAAMAAQGPQPMMQGQPQQPPQPMGIPGMGMGPQPAMPPMPQMGGQPDMMAMMGGMGMPGMEPPKVNALAEMDVDIVIEAAPDMLTLQHEQFEQLADMAGKGVPIPPDVLLEASQIKNKKKLIERLKQEMDVNAKLQQAMQQIEQMQKALQAQDAQKAQAEAQKAQLEMSRLQMETQAEGQRSQIELQKEGMAAQIKGVELEIKQAELQLKQREMGLKAEEMQLRREEMIMNAQMGEQQATVGREQAGRQDRTGEALGMGLQALAQAMSKPKTIKRGPDGRAIGVE
jgi:hypothetical protein